MGIAKSAPLNLAKRVVPIGSNYDVIPWGLQWRSNSLFIIFTIGMGMFSDLFLYTLVVPVIPFLLNDRIGVGPDQVQSLTSLMLSTYAAASMVAAPITGYLADKLASTRQMPFLIGLSALVAATVLFAVGQNLTVLVISRALQGASSGAVWTIGLAMCLETVGPENMGKTVGSIFSVLTAGTLLAPTLGGLLYEKAGYKGVFGVAIGVLAVDLILRLIVIEKKVAKQYRKANGSGTTTPSNGSDGDDEVDEETQLVPKPPDASYEIRTPKSKILQAVPILVCLKDPALLAACALSFTQAYLIATFDATVTIIARDWYHFSPFKAGLLFLPLGVADLICGPPAGWAIDRYGTKPASVIGCLLLTVTMALLRIPQPGGAHEIAVYCVILTLCGVGLSIAGTPGIVEAGDTMEKYHKANPELFGENGPYAQLYGMTSTLFSLGLTLGPWAAGYLKDHIGYGNMNAVMAVTAFLMAVLSALYIGGRVSDVKKLWSKTEPESE